MKKLLLGIFDFVFPVPDPSTTPLTYDKFTIRDTSIPTLDQYKFVFSQAEKRLEDSHKTYDGTTTKSVTLITFSVAVFSTLVTYFFLQNDIDGTFDVKLFTVLVLSICVFFILGYLIRNILPTSYCPSGSNPSLLLNKAFYDDETSEDGTINQDEVMKKMYYSELVSYDQRIDVNFSTNDLRLRRLRRSTIALILLPVLGLGVYLATSFLFVYRGLVYPLF